MKPNHDRKCLNSNRCLLIFLCAWVAPVSAYNSEEHKLLGDWAASEVRLDTTIQLPDPTRLSPLPSSASLNAYTAAKNLAVGFASNTQSEFNEYDKKVQDNSYPPGIGYAQLKGNKNLWIPPANLRRDFGLLVTGHTAASGSRDYTFGDLMSIYGDYRRTPYCDDTGACFLTHASTDAVSFGQGWNCYAFGVGVPDGTPFADCGYRPDAIGTSVYLRHIAAGLWPPYGEDGNTLFNTAKEEDDYFEAGWWGDEMMRIAVSNDWHFSNAAVAWYVGMHRLALHYVNLARTDAKYWNHALHYEANALHSLSDLFAFGHVVTNRDETSFGVMRDDELTGRTTYLWMEHVMDQGGAQRGANGRISLTSSLPVIEDMTHPRNDFLPSYIVGTGWGNWARWEHTYHDDFNHSGAVVRNLRGDELRIFGDAELRKMTPEAQAVIKETIRVSLRSLFDAYVRLDRYGGTVASIGAEGSEFFAALRYIPAFIVSDPGNHFTGKWTSYARRIDVISGTNRIPAAPICEMPYINGGENLPPASAACTTFPTVPANRLPAVPSLVTPTASATGQASSVEFRWTRVADPDGDAVEYDLLVCADSTFPASCGMSYVIPPPVAVGGAMGFGLIPLAMFFGMRARKRRTTLLPAVVVVLAATTLLSCGGGGGGDEVGGPAPPPPPSTDIRHTVAGLQAATTYYWKVIAHDGNGGLTESAVNSFVTR